MPTLLIAEHSGLITEQIIAVMEDQWEIHTCCDGHAAVRSL